MKKMFSSACERNAEPILNVLREEFARVERVLEIGSGTGQHAVYMGQHLPHLIWQTSDLDNYHPSIHAWLEEVDLSNVLPPVKLDMQNPAWPSTGFDGAFSANTSHIMSWEQVQAMFEGIGKLLPAGGVFCVYGPFNIDGRFTSDSNARFDEALRAQAQHMGLRDRADVLALAEQNGLVLHADHAMPANNRLLVWHRR